MRQWLLPGFVVLVAMTALMGERKPTGPAAAAAAESGATPAVPVMAAKVSRLDVPIFLTGLGTVRAFNSVVLTSRVDGQIVKMNFTEGDEVRAGDILVEIDAAPLAAALAQVEAARLKDEASLANARLDFDRAQSLANKGAGTTQALDTARAQVAQLEASTKVDQAAIDAAKVQLNYTKIRSPIDGRTGTRQLDTGNIVHAGGTTGIVTINQIQPISVDFDLPADSLAEVRTHFQTGDADATALDRNDHALAAGKLSVIDNQVNVASGTIRYKATFANRDEALWPGQFVSIRLQLGVRRDALTVPKMAVLRGPEGTYAFVIDAAKRVQKRTIEVGFTDRELAVVEAGLAPGEQVVTDGQYRIETGTLVTIVPQTAQGTN